jgi:hypothetical protein
MACVRTRINAHGACFRAVRRDDWVTAERRRSADLVDYHASPLRPILAIKLYM